MATKIKPYKILNANKEVLFSIKLKRFKSHTSLMPLGNNAFIITDESLSDRLTDSKVQELVWKKYTCSVCQTNESFFIGERNEILCENCYDFHYNKEHSLFNTLIINSHSSCNHNNDVEFSLEEDKKVTTFNKVNKDVLTPTEKLLKDLEELGDETAGTDSKERLAKFNERLSKIGEPRVKKERIRVQKSTDPYILQNTHYLNTTIMLLEELNDYKSQFVEMIGEANMELGAKYYMLKDFTKFNLHSLIDEHLSNDDLVRALAYSNHRYTHQQEVLKNKLERGYNSATIGSDELNYINRQLKCDITGLPLSEAVFINILNGKVVENEVSISDIPFIIKTEKDYIELFENNEVIDVIMHLALMVDVFKPNLIIRGLMQNELIKINAKLNEIMKNGALNNLQMDFSTFWKLHVKRLFELLGEYDINPNLFNINETISIIEEINVFYSK